MKTKPSPEDWERAATLMEELARDMREGRIDSASISMDCPPPPVLQEYYGGPDISDLHPYAREVTLTISVHYGWSESLDMKGEGVIIHHDDN